MRTYRLYLEDCDFNTYPSDLRGSGQGFDVARVSPIAACLHRQHGITAYQFYGPVEGSEHLGRVRFTDSASGEIITGNMQMEGLELELDFRAGKPNGTRMVDIEVIDSQPANVRVPAGWESIG